MKTIIQNGIVVTMDQQMHVWDHGYVIIDGTKIVEVGPESGLMDRKAVLSRAGKGCPKRDHHAGNDQYPQSSGDDSFQRLGG